MSLLPGSVYANETTPCFVPFGGGGSGSNVTLDTLNINQGGDITMGSSIGGATFLTFNKAVDGSTSANLVMEDLLPLNAPPVQLLTLLDGASNYDSLVCGNVYATGEGVSYVDTEPQVVLGTLSGKLGLAFKQGTTGVVTPLIDISDLTTNMTLKSTDAIYTDISGTQIQQPKIQTGSFTSSGASGSQLVTLPQSYSATDYLVFPVMLDTTPAEMSAAVSTVNTFTVYWEQAGAGSHNIAWMTTGL